MTQFYSTQEYPELAAAVVWRIEDRANARVQRCPRVACERPQRVEQSAPQRVVDRPAIVRVDQAVVQDFVALVEIGHAWRRQLDERHRERIEHAEPDERHDLNAEVVEEHVPLDLPEERAYEIGHCRLVRFVRVDPTRMELGLA